MKIRVAKIALAIASYTMDRPYAYRVPEELAELIPGVRVLVPFGPGNRCQEGLILDLTEQEDVAQERPLKPVLACLDDQPVLDRDAIHLALWIRDHWFCTVYEAARAMLPTGLYYALQNRYQMVNSVSYPEALERAGRSKREREIITLLYGHPQGMEIQELRAAFGTKNIAPALRSLTEKGVLSLDTSTTRAIGDKMELHAALAVPAEEALAQTASRRKTAPMRHAVVQFLAETGEAAAKEISYFTGASRATLRSLEKSGILTLSEQEVFRRVLPENIPPAVPIVLNEEQTRAFDGLNTLAASGKAAVALLYGVTGSGKTQVYLRLIQETIQRGKTALILVPEIALTPQLVSLFAAYFGEKVAVLHSMLPSGERYDEWKRIRSGTARVVVGTRSAVFAPLRDLGLLVIDEEQEGSYKSEFVPRYHARDVAKYRAFQNQALLVLSSATPSVETMYHAKQGDYHFFTLAHRYNQQALPSVLVVDMREELRAGNDSPISAPLREALQETMDRGEQSILFLNRRGASRMLTCLACGESPTCPNCSASLTYHSANHRLMCHYCGYSEPLPPACPKCGGTLTFVGWGTQKVEETLQTLFPDREIMRMDANTTTASRSHETLLARFREEKIPILVGTQMVAKGLDFENVTLVGVISADQGLYTDDYRASERAFSLLTQVVGRAGRGGKTGRAILQTCSPNHDILLTALQQDYDRFYEQEILLRNLRGCPPFSAFFVVTVSSTEESRALQVCAFLRDTLCDWQRQGLCADLIRQIFDPTPEAIVKKNKRYRYHVTMLAQNQKPVRELIAHLVRCAQSDRRNRDVSITADIDPIN